MGAHFVELVATTSWLQVRKKASHFPCPGGPIRGNACTERTDPGVSPLRRTGKEAVPALVKECLEHDVSQSQEERDS